MRILLVALLCLPSSWALASGVCRELEQAPQSFLIRGEERKDPRGFAAAIEAAIQYRVEQYGFVPGLTPHYSNSQSAPQQTEMTTFLNLPVRVHRKILPALQCVEAEIRVACANSTYKPAHLSGLRTRNTYGGGEISNHMFGLAVDIDPARNRCCGCVAPWSNDPKCRIHTTDPYARAELPRCWVSAFEKFGFYWLGLDEMQDTMHFEFLGDPSKGEEQAQALRRIVGP
jgi:hypothetical protein